ncbi:MAG: hypothetical protein Q4D74_08625, partial [Comamonadaceae bacterium]|nr:hypothetical protein [Comamonadaceae bacterium]
APSPAPAPVASVGTYAALPDMPDHAALLAQVNRQGAQGYAFVSPVVFGSETGNLFFQAKARAASRLVYEVDPNPLTPELLKKRGADGWAFKSFMGGGAMFVKDDARASKYEYHTEASVTLDLLNEWGQKGYRYLGPAITPSGPMELFMRGHTAGGGTYAYKAPSLSGSTQAELLAQLQQQGEDRQLYVGPMDTDKGNSLFVTGPMQTKKLEYALKDYNAIRTMTQMVTELNAMAADGYVYLGAVAFGNNAFGVYVKGLMLPVVQPLSGTIYP